MSNERKSTVSSTCYDCKYCIKKGKNFTCKWKKCNMGKFPFYELPDKFQKRTIINLEFVVCSFEERVIQKKLDEYTKYKEEMI